MPKSEFWRTQVDFSSYLLSPSEIINGFCQGLFPIPSRQKRQRHKSASSPYRQVFIDAIRSEWTLLTLLGGLKKWKFMRRRPISYPLLPFIQISLITSTFSEYVNRGFPLLNSKTFHSLNLTLLILSTSYTIISIEFLFSFMMTTEGR